MKRTRGFLLVLSCVASASAAYVVGCSDDDDPGATVAPDAGTDANVAQETAPTTEAGSDSGDKEAILARGKYLVDHVFECGGCHTPDIINADGSRAGKDMTKYLAGGDCIFDADPTDPAKGCINSANLTTDATGLKNISDADLKKIITTGVRPDGKTVLHVMPWWKFALAKAEDLDAAIAYLRTVPPINRVAAPHQPPYDTARLNLPPLEWDQMPKPKEGTPDMASAERGRYLAAFTCYTCHTPDNPLAPAYPDVSRGFTGNVFNAGVLIFKSPPYPENIYSCNLTSDVETGLGGWTKDQIHRVLTEGKDRDGGGICSPMPVIDKPGFDAIKKLTEADRNDIINYVMSLPPVKHQRPADCVEP